jgi:hypothetical protein
MADKPLTSKSSLALPAPSPIELIQDKLQELETAKLDCRRMLDVTQARIEAYNHCLQILTKD